MVVDDIPDGYFIARTERKLKPAHELIAKRLQSYEALKLSPKPVKEMTEREALKRLRATKRIRKADFRKRMKKELTEALSGTEYAPLAPYYAIAAGGFLSSEYELLTVESSKTETLAFVRQMNREELLSEPITGTVIAKCPDGDIAVLKADGTVTRVSHESPEETEHWPNIAEFIAEAIAADDESEE